MKKGRISANSRNIFNRENFAAPAAGNLEALTARGTPAPNFGMLTSTRPSAPDRQIQFALKLLW
jgi:hypothetical protein